MNNLEENRAENQVTVDERDARLVYPRIVAPGVVDPSNPYPLQAPIVLKKAVSTRVLNRLSLQYGRTVTARVGSGVHHHPNLAVERAMLLEIVRDTLDRNNQGAEIFDVYGNQREMRRMHIPAFSYMPLKHATDQGRREAADWDYACECESLSQCVHKERCDLALWVQSIQYCSVKEVAEILLAVGQQTGYALLHRFDGICGSFHKDEQVWYRDSDSTVHCTMDGGRLSWSHNACDWLDFPTYVDGIGIVVAQHVSTVGQTHLYRLTLSDSIDLLRPPTDVEPWEKAKLDYKEGTVYSLPSTFLGAYESAMPLHGASLRVPFVRVFSKIIVFMDEQWKHVVLSYDVVATCAASMLGQPFDAAAYRALIRKIVNHYREMPNFPTTKLAESVLTTTLLVVSKIAKLETPIITQFLYNFDTINAARNETIRFEPRPYITKSAIIQTVSWTALGFAVEYYYPPYLATNSLITSSNLILSTKAVAAHSMLSVPLTGAISVVVPPVLIAWWSFSAVVAAGYFLYNHSSGRHEESVVLGWRDSVPGYRPNQPMTFAALKFTPKFLGIKDVKASPLQDQDCHITVMPDVFLDREPKPLLELQGIAFSALPPPTYYSTTQDNLVSAIEGRLFREVPEPVPGAWDKATCLIEKSLAYRKLHQPPFNKVFVNRQALDNWVNGKYSEARKEDLRKAFLDFEERGVTRKDGSMQVFTKTEKQVALLMSHDDIMDFHELKIPRLICSVSDVEMSFMGPICCQIAEHQRKIYEQLQEERGISPTAPRGCSSEKLGEWYTDVLEYFEDHDFGSVVIIESDGKQFDAHVREEAIRSQNKTLFSKVKIIADDPIIAQRTRNFLLNPAKIRGASRKGVRFVGTVARATGQNTTDLGNTDLNSKHVVYIMEKGSDSMSLDEVSDIKELQLGRRYFFAVSGDDSLVITTDRYLHHVFSTEDRYLIKELIEAKALDLGFEDTVCIRGNLWEAEYCSKVFYPVFRGTMYKPGAKIGRALSRAGWFLDYKGAQTMKSACVGALQDNYHVPFLREYFEATLRLFSNNAPMRGSPTREHEVHAEVRTPYDQSTLDFVYSRYGLTPQDLLEFKTLLAQQSSLPIVINWPPIVALMQVDSA